MYEGDLIMKRLPFMPMFLAILLSAATVALAVPYDDSTKGFYVVTKKVTFATLVQTSAGLDVTSGDPGQWQFVEAGSVLSANGYYVNTPNKKFAPGGTYLNGTVWLPGGNTSYSDVYMHVDALREVSESEASEYLSGKKTISGGAPSSSSGGYSSSSNSGDNASESSRDRGNCLPCSGKGERNCSVCLGKGGYSKPNRQYGQTSGTWQTCGACGGGRKEACPVCNGTGKR
ncbi:hypothetical protein LJC74_01625 [Eubacteriales bacterium OttesenSCG-928-A19]|nr:hypothetical protein [Eubacteriales bacterium OttesenSCG-928-A19]